MIVDVPIGTVVYIEKENLFGDLNEDGKMLSAKGGVEAQ